MISEWKKSLLRNIPSTDELLQFNKTTGKPSGIPHYLITEITRGILEKVRQRIMSLDKSEAGNFVLPDKNELLYQIEKELHQRMLPGFRRVINGTGIVLHTSLGRAVLSPNVLEAFNKNLIGYTILASDLKTGKRKDRDRIIENLICEITGAEYAFIVNNNAAATILILNTIAKGKEVICSRGQMVEIGGSFRIPEIMETSGAKLVSVGATNRTHLKDYEKAIRKETGALLRVHNSNFRIVGFTSEVTIKELVQLGKKHKLPVIDDLGSGALVDLSTYGFKDEPLVSESIKAGADIICFSADKLLGGPQGGIILCKKKYLEPLRKNPLARAFRIDKLDLIALEATLNLFRNKETLFQTNPTLKMLTTDIKTIETRAQNLKNKLQAVLPNLELNVIDEYSQPGSGSLAGYNIPTKAVAVRIKTISSQKLTEKLRERDIPIFTRLKDNQILFDLRTILDGEEEEIANAFKEIIL